MGENKEMEMKEMENKEMEPVDIVLGDLCAPLDWKDCPHIHRLVLVPDCLCVAYAAGKGNCGQFRPILGLDLFSPVGHDGSLDVNTVPVAVDSD